MTLYSTDDTTHAATGDDACHRLTSMGKPSKYGRGGWLRVFVNFRMVVGDQLELSLAAASRARLTIDPEVAMRTMVTRVSLGWDFRVTFPQRVLLIK